jgi:hypothetical protein
MGASKVQSNLGGASAALDQIRFGYCSPPQSYSTFVAVQLSVPGPTSPLALTGSHGRSWGRTDRPRRYVNGNQDAHTRFRKRGDLIALAGEECIGTGDEPATPRLHRGRKGRSNLAFGAGMTPGSCVGRLHFSVVRK